MQTLEAVLLKASEQVPGLVIFALFAGLIVIGFLKHMRFWADDLKKIVEQSDNSHKQLHEQHRLDRDDMVEAIRGNSVAFGTNSELLRSNTEILRNFVNGRYSK